MSESHLAFTGVIIEPREPTKLVQHLGLSQFHQSMWLPSLTDYMVFHLVYGRPKSTDKYQHLFFNDSL